MSLKANNSEEKLKDRIHQWTNLLADIDHTDKLSSDLSRIGNLSTESIIVNDHEYRINKVMLALRFSHYK